MMTPNLVADTQEELIGAFESEKIFKFLHLPVQSGDDKVLMACEDSTQRKNSNQS